MSVKFPPQVEFNRRRKTKRVVLHFIEPRSGHHAANLHFFSERQQIRLHVEMLATPGATSGAQSGLHFVENQQDVALVADLAQLPQPFATEMIVAAFALDRFDYDRGDVGPAFIDEFPNFRFRFFPAGK